MLFTGTIVFIIVIISIVKVIVDRIKVPNEHLQKEIAQLYKRIEGLENGKQERLK